MDPNACLTEMVRLATAVLSDDGPTMENAIDAAALAEHVIALDQWLRGGGFLPARWEKGDRS